MGGYTNKRPQGYLECDYTQPWPGLFTALPSSQIPPGACTACNAMAVRGRLTPQPAIFNVTGTGGMNVTMPTFAAGENVCWITFLEVPGTQQVFTIIITTLAVYIDYVVPTSIGSTKAFTKIFTFPAAYPRYARFSSCVIGNTLYFSSASLLGVYAVRPTFSVSSVEVVNQGGYFTSAPTVVFSDGGGTGATGTAHLTGSLLTSVSVGSGGSLYLVPPIVNLAGGSTTGPAPGYQLASAIAVLSAAPASYIVQEVSAFTGVAYIDLTAPTGSGYTAPTVAFIGGGGTGATATAILSTDGLGSILGVTMDSPGQNYTSAPTLKIIDPTGTGANVPIASLFQGQPFIGGDYMAAIAGRLVLANIIGGDGNTTFSVQNPTLTTEGGGYTSPPSAQFVGGGGEGATGYTTLNSGGSVGSIAIGSSIGFNGIITSGSDVITGVSSLSGIQTGMGLSDNSFGIPASTTVIATAVISNIYFTGNIAATGSTSITSASSTTGLLAGQPIASAYFPPGTVIDSISGSTVNVSQGAVLPGTGVPIVAVPGNSITMSHNATQSTTEGITATGFVQGNQGNGYYSTPEVSILGNASLTATAFAQLGQLPERYSSQTRYPDRLQWSAPDAYGYFDPNYLIAPGGYNTLSEASGIITGLSVMESVLFVGHNGGETETTPNAGNAEIPFAFYPLWSSPTGVVVRYGSMAQYGTTTCFLSNDNAYMLNPSGLTPIGGNIANLLQNCSTWNNGNYPLQGLYGSIVVIEGELHYLIALSSDDWDLQGGSGFRQTTVFDYNLNANNWHQWSYGQYTLTCPIAQSFDTASYSPNSTANNTQIARDAWLLAGLTESTGAVAPFGEAAVVFEAVPLTRQIQLLAALASPVAGQTFLYQGRNESPSPARMQSERRILIEYENEPILEAQGITPALTAVYTGQQDPTVQTGTVVQTQTQTATLNYLATALAGQVLTQQTDFGTFTGVCTSINLSGGQNDSLVSLVRITQVADLPKAQVP